MDHEMNESILPSADGMEVTVLLMDTLIAMSTTQAKLATLLAMVTITLPSADGTAETVFL